MPATTMSIASRDIYNRVKRTLLRFPNTATLAQLQTYATSYTPLQRALQGCNIEEIEVKFSLTVPANAASVANINAQNGANFSFINASLNKYGVWVPGVDPDLFVGKKDILTSDSRVTDWLVYITTGNGTIAPVNEAEQDLGALASAIQSHRK